MSIRWLHFRPMTDKAKSQTWVLLLRGINVNPTTRLAMADLRSLLGSLGYQDVQTLLQSGNVLLSSPRRPAASPIEAAIAFETRVKSRPVVLSLAEFRAVADANPLLDAGDDLSKLVITFLDEDIVPTDMKRPSDDELAPERLVIRPRAVYQWLPDGVLQSKLKPAWWRQFGPLATARNVRTVNRILEAASTSTTAPR
jgi:uncharacterized protein (DUF1697 family)